MGIEAALRLVFAEGVDQVFARHMRHGEACRAAVRGWGLEVLAQNPAEFSPVLTGVVVPHGHDADALRYLIRLVGAERGRSASISLFALTLGLSRPPREFGINAYSTPLLPAGMKRLSDYAQGAALMAGESGLRARIALAEQDAKQAEREMEELRALATNARLTLHVVVEAGSNAHHVIEAMFKAVARALRMAAAIDPAESGVPSTKGTLV